MIGRVSAAPRAASEGSPNHLTIEQLAHESGMSVRNIRSHQARGLLPPPEVRLRVGYYGPEHVAQLRLIRELQEEGFNLGGIKRLLDDTHGTAERLLRFRDAFTAPLHDERTGTVTIAELARRFPMSAGEAEEAMAKAQKLGVFVARGDGVYAVPSPQLLSVAEEVVKRGISVAGALEILGLISKHCDAVSRALVNLFLRDVWKPFEEAGMPDERWPEVEESLARLRPMAAEALLTIFRQRMSGEVESAFGEITQPLSRERG